MTKPSPLTADLSDIVLEPEDFTSSVPLKKVPHGDVFEAARAGDVDRLRYLLESGVNVNARDKWDSVALYYACLAGHFDSARMLLENGAICSEYTFDGDRCHYAALNLKVRKLLKDYEARPPAFAPLPAALRETFLACKANKTYLEQSDVQFQFSGTSSQDQVGSSYGHFPPDITFYVQGRPIEAHRVILSARSPFFKMKFKSEWKGRTEVRFSKEKLSYPALYSLIHFFYCDRLEAAVDDLEDLVRICKVCRCESLQRVLENEMVHHKFADYKALADIDGSQKRFILQGLSLPEEDRLPACLHRILQCSLEKSKQFMDDISLDLAASVGILEIEEHTDLTDICIRVDKMNLCCHQVVLASRSEYFKTRIFRLKDFYEGKNSISVHSFPYLEEHDLSKEVLEKMIEYMYTDSLKDIDPDQAEEMFDAASRYLLFPLKRAVADVLLPHLEMVSSAELCHWLLLSDMYGVVKIREYCLDTIACNFETFADTPEFRAMLSNLPPPSGDSSLRTTAPNAPGAVVTADQGNLLDDLREKWLEIEAAELDKRDESALLFDKRLEVLMLMAEHEKSVSEDKSRYDSDKICPKTCTNWN